MKKVLIIEDNKLFLETLKDFLETKGFSVETLMEGSGALEKVKKINPDIILVDVLLPGKDGFQICSQLKNDVDTASIPIVLMTGDETVDIDKGFSLGADDCIFKPFDLNDVEHRIINIVEKKRRILIVDDDRKIGDMLTIALTKEKYDVHVLYDGSNIFDVIRKENPDLIFLDISLQIPPTGLEISRQIKSNALTKHVPLLMFTGSKDAEMIDKCFEHGADDYLFKPFTIPELLEKIKKYLK